MVSGLEVSSSQVSRLTAKLDDELSKWRDRLLGRCQYLILDAKREKVRPGGASHLEGRSYRQRCQVHIMRNATGCAPDFEIKSRIPRELKDIFDWSTEEEAKRLLDALVDKYRKGAPKLSKWLETNVPEGFTVFTSPQRAGASSEPQTRLRT